MDHITNNNGYRSLLKATSITYGLKMKDRGTQCLDIWSSGQINIVNWHVIFRG
jgi:hypothetical protein